MPDARTDDGLVAAEISRCAVQVLREYTGRGPTKARTVLTRDTVAIIFADTLTKGERSLVGMGEEEHVLRARRSYQQLMRPDLVRLVEEQTGRTVHAFFSDNQIGPDYGVEFFLLDPFPSGQGADGAHTNVDGAHTNADGAHTKVRSTQDGHPATQDGYPADDGLAPQEWAQDGHPPKGRE